LLPVWSYIYDELLVGELVRTSNMLVRMRTSDHRGSVRVESASRFGQKRRHRGPCRGCAVEHVSGSGQHRASDSAPDARC